MVVKRKSTRLLITWILAVAMLSAFGAEAFAAVGARTWGRASVRTAVRTSRQLPRPMAGEPDVPQGNPAPNAKDGATPPGAQLPLALQIRLGLATVLNLPRLP